MADEVLIRPYQDGDPIPEITAMLHRAYAPLAAAGMRYLATHQDDATTLRRLTDGYSLVAECGGRVVGVISAYWGSPEEHCSYYRRENLMYFGQFGVDPSMQGTGLGRKLYNAIEDYVRCQGVKEIALDTSERATDLISLYRAWGFEVVGEVRWHEANYRSVVMAKPMNV